MKKIVYGWFDGEDLFYVGIGDKYRSTSRSGRNNYCKNKRAKAERKGTFRVVIFHKGLTQEQACEIECQLIQQYGRLDKGTGCLTNMTDGGEGVKSVIRTKESRLKQSESISGNKHHLYGKKRSKETRRKISQSNSKIKGALHHRSIAVMTPLGLFESCRLASLALKCDNKTVIRRAKSNKFPDYYFSNT